MSQISISQELRDFAERQALRGGLKNADEFVAQLLEERQMSEAQREREAALLLEAIDNPQPVEMDSQTWADFKRSLDPQISSSGGSSLRQNG